MDVRIGFSGAGKSGVGSSEVSGLVEVPCGRDLRLMVGEDGSAVNFRQS